MSQAMSHAPRSTLAVVLAAVVMLGAGCSSGSSGTGEGSASATPAASSGSATATATAGASETAGLPAPVIVTPSQGAAEAHVGETIVFNQPDPAHTQISTDRPDVLEVIQGRDDGSALFNPGAKALAPGVAVVTIKAADGSTEKVTVTVRE